MRVFAVSDLHLDYEENARWLAGLSTSDYKDDLLILAGDVSDSLKLLEWSLKSLASRFRKVLYVPGNHDLWVIRDNDSRNSLEKFKRVCTIAGDCSVSMKPYHVGSLSIVPLLGWYDYSFGQPSEELTAIWMDYRACVWPSKFSAQDITSYFIEQNVPSLQTVNEVMISFSHFLPRLDVMPDCIPLKKKVIYPVLGTTLIEKQIRRLKSTIHIYGHSHVNRHAEIDGVSYINNAFGYPAESRITSKRLICIYET
jgi:predicted phosphodiesterase